MFILAAAAAAAAVPACSARELAISTDARNGYFNGMSHSGTYLVIRNAGRRACRIAGLPAIHFLDASGRALPVTRRAPTGMHPGPVVTPVTIPAGGRVATGLRWVSGPVYDRGRKLDVRSVCVAVAAHRLRVPLRAQMFGPAGQPAMVDQPPLVVFR